MATFANLEKFRAICDFLPYLSPFYTPPCQTVSRAVQTAPIDQTSAEEVLKSIRKATRALSDKMKAFEKRRSSSPPRSPKSIDLDSVRKARITKRSSKRPRRITKCKGLRNSSQTCYQNSVIQCLFNMPQFVAYLDGIHNEKWCPTNKAGLCVVCALKDLLKFYADRRFSDVPDEVRDRLQMVMENSIPDDHALAEDVKKQIQSDPFDFLRYLVQEVQKHESKDSDVTPADLFDIEAKTEWTCDKCGNIKTGEDKKVSSEGDVGLMLNIREPKTGLRMTAYLDHSEYRCTRRARCESTACNEEHAVEGEGSKREVKKHITKAPELLVIRLNRFATGAEDPTTGHLKEIKISNPVPFEEYINLGEFTELGAPIFYQLQGVIGHSGNRTSSGHYVAAVRKPDGGTFCSINDDIAISEDRGGNVDELYRIRNMHGDFDPYVLFYSKV